MSCFQLAGGAGDLNLAELKSFALCIPMDKQQVTWIQFNCDAQSLRPATVGWDFATSVRLSRNANAQGYWNEPLAGSITFFDLD